MFGKPGGPMKLPETSYYHRVEDEAWKERMDHQRQDMDVDVLAGKLVKDIKGCYLARGICFISELGELAECYVVCGLNDKLSARVE